jgi:hypothetical protein
MTWSLIDAETAGGKAGQSRNRSPIAMAEYSGDFDENVSGNGQLTRM